MLLLLITFYTNKSRPHIYDVFQSSALECSIFRRRRGGTSFNARLELRRVAPNIYGPRGAYLYFCSESGPLVPWFRVP